MNVEAKDIWAGNALTGTTSSPKPQSTQPKATHTTTLLTKQEDITPLPATNLTFCNQLLLKSLHQLKCGNSLFNNSIR